MSNSPDPIGTWRRTRLAQSRLYLVCDAQPGGRDLEGFLDAALRGGVDVVQLRDKALGDDEVKAAALVARDLCQAADVLLILNDRPDLALEVKADGVHLGQDDMAIAEARALLGQEVLIGLSTHSAEEIDAARGVDYIGVGPVHATPTKPGRPAVGTDLVEHAAARANVPFFAIGGIAPDTLGPVLEAGAHRVAVVRALTEADDPEETARRLRGRMLGVEEASVGAT